MGKWKAEDNDNPVEGSWKNGKIDGKAVEKRNEYQVTYQLKNGKKDGKQITYYKNGRREEMEWKDGE